MEKYIVITEVDGAIDQTISTRREVIDLWREDNEAGYLDRLEVWHYDSVTSTMARVNVYEMAQEFMKEQREIEAEYEEYSEAVREYGYDYNVENDF